MALKYVLDHEGQKVSIREIADNLRIPFDTTSQVFQRLKRHGLAVSIQGVTGGYTLSEKVRNLSFLELSEIIENKKFYEDCEDKNCSYIGNCTIQTPIKTLQKQLHQTFHNLKVLDLIQQETIVEQ